MVILLVWSVANLANRTEDTTSIVIAVVIHIVGVTAPLLGRAERSPDDGVEALHEKRKPK